MKMVLLLMVQSVMMEEHRKMKRMIEQQVKANQTAIRTSHILEALDKYQN